MFYEEIQQAAAFIRQKVRCCPATGIILGSGLGEVADSLEHPVSISYADIPGFPVSSVAGHAARLVFGNVGGREVVAMQGRFHYYEGLTMREVAFPVYVLHELGVRNLIVTNACGGINAEYAPGDLMLIRDHLNLSGANPLIGPNEDALGPRFPDMTEVYDRSLADFARGTAKQLAVPLREGVYAFYPGPCYETAAEIQAYRALGADAVGMSTVPEATAARYLGMRVLGLSCITNLATGLARTKHSHEEVLEVAQRSGATFRRLVRELLENFPDAVETACAG